jgi:hypothetical protein
MPQAIAAQLVAWGVSQAVASIAAYAVTTAATYFASGLLRGGPPKPDASEREHKSPTPPRIHVLGARRVFWSAMLYTNTSDSETVDVGAFCEGPINAVLQPYLNDDKVTISGGYVQPLSDGSYDDNKVLAGYNLGANPNTAHAAVVSRVPSWTSDHRGDGIVSGYLIKTGVKSKDFLDVYPQGDNVTMSLAVQGHFCHDPRDPASDPYDPSTWPYTENAALHYLWFKTVFMGNDYATKIAPVEQMWIDAANDCDIAIPLAAGGTEPKYRAAIVFPADADPVQVDDMIRATFDGWSAVDENGCIRVHSGKLYEPTVSIGPDQIVDYELQEFVEDEDRLNEIITRYVSAAHDYNEVECQPWRDDSDIAERGKIVSTTVDHQVPSHTQARRLDKRQMARVNAPQRGRVRTVFSAREALTERFINLRIEDAGTVFFAGRVEVIGGERDSETGGAIIEWVAVDENVDVWNPETEDGQPAPTSSKYYLPPLITPSIADAIAQIDSSSSFARIAVAFDPVDVAAPTWFVRWRIDGDASYIEQEVTADGNTLLTGSVPTNAMIDVGIAYSSGGRFSGWSTDATVSTSTANLAPAAPSEVTATGGAGEAEVTWRNPSSSNLSYVKLFRNTTNDFGTAAEVSGEIVGGLGQVMSVVDDSLAADDYWWWVVAYNSNDVASAPGGPAAATVT